MNNLIQKAKSSKQEAIVGALILVLTSLYLLTRFINLTIIPVFADEAIYLRWAQVMQAVPSLRFLPLSDGKQPLFMWLVIPFLKIFSDPLFAGRVLSVLTGLGGILGIYFLCYLLFKNKIISLFALILYLITPYIYFFNRMALPDNMLSVLFVWSLIFLILTVKYLRLDTAMIAGILIGLAWLTKSPAIFLFALMPITILLFSFSKEKKNLQMAKLAGYWAIIGIFSFTIYNILRLGAEFHMIAIRNRDYVFTITDVLQHPFNPLIGNLKSVINWFWIWLTPVISVLGVTGMFLSIKKSWRSGLFLLLCFMLPLIAQSLIAKVYTARYVLFLVPFWLIFSAFTIEKIFITLKNKILTTAILVGIFIFPVYQITLLMFNPQKAWIPANEREGYLQLWTAGYGINESAEYIKSIALSNKVLVGTEGYFGTLPDGLQIYLNQIPNITVIGVGYPIKETPKQLKDGLIDNRVFLLVNDSRFLIANPNDFNLVAKYPKAVSRDGTIESLLFFELLKNYEN